MTFAGMVPAMTFDSLAACRQYASRVGGLIQPGLMSDGRIAISGVPLAGPNKRWYECRSKHVDTWEPAR
jgi:hypothetical protein